MAVIQQQADLDFGGVGKIIRALLNPVASDPGSPVVGEVWYNTSDSRLKVETGAGTVSLATTGDTGSGVPASTWDAQSVVVAISDDTPVVQVLAASTLLGRRATGDVTAVTYAQLLADLEALGITAADVGGNDPFARANHTGSQASSTISDFNSSVDTRVQLIVDSAPAALDTLNELAAALGDDANFSTTITNSLATKPTRYAENIGDNSSTSIAVTHSLGTTDVVVQVFVISSGATVDCQVVRTNANTVTLDFNTAPGTDAYRVVVHGIS